MNKPKKPRVIIYKCITCNMPTVDTSTEPFALNETLHKKCSNPYCVGDQVKIIEIKAVSSGDQKTTNHPFILAVEKFITNYLKQTWRGGSK